VSQTRQKLRADIVGSLLRPGSVHEAHRRHQSGAIDDAELRAIEDAAISDVIVLQERIGLRVVTDGEFRRENWWIDFVPGKANVRSPGMRARLERKANE
jgi:5-methyltetrahydropteroyltriglutamate--homocysteine methyltransferase